MNKNQMIVIGIVLVIPSIAYIGFKIVTDDEWREAFVYVVLPIMILLSFLLGITLIISGLVI